MPVHIVQVGESLVSIASHYGFGSVAPLEQVEANARLLQERGADGVQPGDELEIPPGQHGHIERGTGRGHEVVVRRLAGLFELRLYTELSKENTKAAGDKNERDTTGMWRAVFLGKGKPARPITQLKASIEIRRDPDPSGSSHTGFSDRKKGIFHAPKLEDGTWILSVTPLDDELSTGAAAPDATADHGLGRFERNGKAAKKDEAGKSIAKPTRAFPNNRVYELEYRPLSIEITVAGSKITQARIRTAAAPHRPHHAVLFWTNVPDVGDNQVLEVDWKPDFIRRVVSKLRPKHALRSKVSGSREPADTIDLIMLHHTAGFTVGGALSTFFASSSGAQFVIDIDGHVIRLADDRYEVKHGGGGRKTRTPAWRTPRGGGGRRSVNARAIGIEHVHKDPPLNKDSLGENDAADLYSEAQYVASIELVRELRASYDVRAANVVGHQDCVAKAACPGWHFDWERFETAGVSLAPQELTATQSGAMFGGFFAGADGASRVLPIGAKATRLPTGRYEVRDKRGKLLASDLASSPIHDIREALSVVGYAARDSIVVSGKRHAYKESAHRDLFEFTLGFALSQFIRHFCTMGRVRTDLHQAYRDSPRVSKRLAVDMALATLLRGAELAADAEA